MDVVFCYNIIETNKKIAEIEDNYKMGLITNEEKERDLYWLNPTLICQAIYGSPSVAPFIITKIINYK